MKIANLLWLYKLALWDLSPFSVSVLRGVWGAMGGEDGGHLDILVWEDNGNNIKRLIAQLLLMNSTGLPYLNDPTKNRKQQKQNFLEGNVCHLD